jgi:hypothetical protein
MVIDVCFFGFVEEMIIALTRDDAMFVGHWGWHAAGRLVHNRRLVETTIAHSDASAHGLKEAAVDERKLEVIHRLNPPHWSGAVIDPIRDRASFLVKQAGVSFRFTFESLNRRSFENDLASR